MKGQYTQQEIDETQEVIGNLRGLLQLVEMALPMYVTDNEAYKRLEAQRVELLQDINKLQLSIWNYD